MDEVNVDQKAAAVKTVKIVELSTLFRGDQELVDKALSFFESEEIGYTFGNAGTLINKWDVLRFCIKEMIFDDTVIALLGEADHCVVWA
jgi:hypothetical protein